MPIVSTAAAFTAANSANIAAMAAKKADCRVFMESYKHTADVVNMQVYSMCVDMLHPLVMDGGLTPTKALAFVFVIALFVFVVAALAYSNVGERIVALIWGIGFAMGLTGFVFCFFIVLEYIYRM